MKNVTEDSEFIELIDKLNDDYLDSIDKPFNLSKAKPKKLSNVRDLIISAEFHGKQNMIPAVSNRLKKILNVFKKKYVFEYKYKSRKT